MSLWDAEYGFASEVKQTADIAADKLMRSRSNRVLYGAPPPYTGIGRPRVHGNKFKRLGPNNMVESHPNIRGTRPKNGVTMKLTNTTKPCIHNCDVARQN